MSEWTRYCEAGSCVEHRTVDGKVFVRNSSDEDRMLEFTAAEWDTFLAGMTAQVAAERDEARAALAGIHQAVHGADADRHTFPAGCADLTIEVQELVHERDPARMVMDLVHAREALTAERDKLGQDYVRVMTERDNMAAENARLRQQRDEAITTGLRDLNQATDERAMEATRADEAEADRDRYKAGAKQALTELAEALRQRDAAIAEAAVLRHAKRERDMAFDLASDAQRQIDAMWPVVEAAVEWLAVASVTQAPWWWTPDRTVHALTAAVEAYQNGPLAAPESTLPAEQPQPVAQPTDGPEPQGEAQRAPASDPLGSPPGSGERARIAAEKLPTVGQWPGRPKPRVWNAGDPEPEGVERVTDRVGDEWCRIDGWWSTTGNGEDYISLDWEDLLVVWAPLTEVLPEPTPATAENDPDDMERLRAHTIEAYANLAHDPRQMAYRAVWLAICDGTADKYVWRGVEAALDAYEAVLNSKPDGGDVAEQARVRAEFRAMADDWTSKDGCTNSSDEYLRLSDEVGRLIRGQAHALLRGDAASVGRLIMAQLAHVHGLAPTESDGAVPETGRAGEAQTKDQDRTEVGLDAAIEAAWQAYRDARGPAGHFQAIEAAVRAASPLIERAALNAAAKAYQATFGVVGGGQVADWLRDRATRTEVPQ